MNLRRAIHTWAALALVVSAGCSDSESLEPTNNQNNNSATNNNTTTNNNNTAEDAGVVEDASVAVDAGSTTADAGSVTPTSEVETLDIGTVTLGFDGDSQDVSFDIPEGVTSFMVQVKGADTANYIIKRMTGPNDLVLVSEDTSNVTQVEMFLLGPFAAQFKSPNRVTQDLGHAAFMFPNNPGIEISAGTYTMVITGFTVQGQQGVPYVGDVQVSLKYRTQEPSAGYLPVTLHFTGAGGIDAASAPTDSFIQDALVRLGEIYSQAGVSVGEFQYFDADPAYQTMSAGDGTLGDLENMFATTADYGPGLHYFFVDRFESNFPGGMIAGISGGLPGPAHSQGSVNSGVAVALGAINGDAGVLAHVMAHEGGHWLGLFHTSEITGTADQMPDTPEGQAGQNHLMYPAVGGGTTLSPSQCDVLRRHMETIAQ